MQKIYWKPCHSVLYSFDINKQYYILFQEDVISITLDESSDESGTTIDSYLDESSVDKDKTYDILSQFSSSFQERVI